MIYILSIETLTKYHDQKYKEIINQENKNLNETCLSVEVEINLLLGLFTLQVLTEFNKQENTKTQIIKLGINNNPD